MSTVRLLAKCEGFDVGIEDHGILVLGGYFHCEDGTAQGLGLPASTNLLRGIMGVFGVHRLRDVNGKTCRIVRTNERITRIEPLFKEDGCAFDL